MLILGLGFIAGIFLGSLVDCLAYRSVTNKSFWGRSNCPKCHKTLGWYDLFPLFSYIFLKGRCRYCRKPISPEYPLIELLTGALAALLFLQRVDLNYLSLPPEYLAFRVLELVFSLFIICILVTVFVTDIKTGLIPDRITYPVIIISLFYLIFEAVFKSFLLYRSLMNSPLGKYLLPPNSDFFVRHVIIEVTPNLLAIATAFVIGLFFFLLIFLTRGRGMGGGDMKLGIFMGLALGFPQALSALMLAFLTGSIFGVALLLIGKKKLGQTIPFGPFLSLGSLLALFWGEQILSWYLNFKFF